MPGRGRVTRLSTFTMIAVLAITVGATAGPAIADPGDLDPSFGIGGSVATSLGRGGEPAAVAVGPGGRVVVAGPNRRGISVARFTSEGDPDGGFAGDGRVTIRFDAPAAVADAIVDDDGRVVVSGTVDRRVVVIRLDANGRPDPAFGIQGVLQFGFGGRSFGSELALDRTSILIAASVERIRGFRFAAARLLQDGTFDPTFDGDGKVTVALDPRVGGVTGMDMVGGRIVLTGDVDTPSNQKVAIVRLTEDGDPDTAFSGDGRRAVAVGRRVRATDVQIDGRGRTLVMARVVDDVFAFPYTVLFRLGPRGGRSTMQGGEELIASREIHAPTEIVLDAREQILVSGGLCCGGGSEYVHAVARFDPDGAPDPRFGEHGIAEVGGFHAMGLSDLALGPADRIVVTGLLQYDRDVQIARLKP